MASHLEQLSIYLGYCFHSELVINFGSWPIQVHCLADKRLVDPDFANITSIMWLERRMFIGGAI